MVRMKNSELAEHLVQESVVMTILLFVIENVTSGVSVKMVIFQIQKMEIVVLKMNVQWI